MAARLLPRTIVGAALSAVSDTSVKAPLPVSIHGVPAHCGAEPPNQLSSIVRFGVGPLTRIANCVRPAVAMLRAALWWKVLRRNARSRLSVCTQIAAVTEALPNQSRSSQSSTAVSRTRLDTLPAGK